LNHAYRIDHPHRSWWRKIALSLGLGVLVGSLMVASVAIGTWGRDIIGWLFLTVLHRAAGPALADVIRWVMLLALMWVVLSLIYNWLPDRVQSFRWNLPGTYAVMMLWVIISLGFSVYASHFNHYNRTYGSLGVVILLMLYLYVLSFALLIGGEINALFATEDGSPP
jgi:membrane protein